MPVVLGDGMRLLGSDLDLNPMQGIELRPIREIEDPEVTHVRYRVNGRARLAWTTA